MWYFPGFQRQFDFLGWAYTCTLLSCISLNYEINWPMILLSVVLTGSWPVYFNALVLWYRLIGFLFNGNVPDWVIDMNFVSMKQRLNHRYNSLGLILRLWIVCDIFTK